MQGGTGEQDAPGAKVVVDMDDSGETGTATTSPRARFATAITGTSGGGASSEGKEESRGTTRDAEGGIGGSSPTTPGAEQNSGVDAVTGGVVTATTATRELLPSAPNEGLEVPVEVPGEGKDRGGAGTDLGAGADAGATPEGRTSTRTPVAAKLLDDILDNALQDLDTDTSEEKEAASHAEISPGSATFAQGDRIRVTKTSRIDLNGSVGFVVTAPSTATGRYVVSLDNLQETDTPQIALRSKNVTDEWVDPADAAADARETVRAILLAQVSDVKDQDMTQHLALSTSVIRGDTQETRRLLEEGAEADPEAPKGATLLQLAVHLGNLDMVKVLLEYGCDANRISCDQSAIYLAGKQGYVEIFRLLLAHGADANMHFQGVTLFHPVCQIGHTEIAKLVLEMDGCDVSSQYIKDGTTPFFMAVQEGRIDIVRLLIEQTKPFDINAAADFGGDSQHITPLHMACSMAGRSMCVRWFYWEGREVTINKMCVCQNKLTG